MVREIVKIDEDLCTGCGECVPGCHEGALQIIDGKARLISDLMCDGLGACIGHCPTGAITIEKREAEAYDEIKVMQIMVKKGKNTVIAHLKHLKEHNETVFLKQAVSWMHQNENSIEFNVNDVINSVHGEPATQASSFKPLTHAHAGSGCPGSRTMDFSNEKATPFTPNISGSSELRQWPVQMHLISPIASYFQGADVVLAADCVPFATGNFHDKFLKGKALAIGCPKLDEGQDVYVEKIIRMVDEAKINTLQIIIMEVPCCGGLLRLAKTALQHSNRKVPLNLTVISIKGKVIS